MYGANYGYRSGLNQSMLDHLTRAVHGLERRFELHAGRLAFSMDIFGGSSRH
jgi:hypothetical protein